MKDEIDKHFQGIYGVVRGLLLISLIVIAAVLIGGAFAESAYMLLGYDYTSISNVEKVSK